MNDFEGLLSSSEYGLKPQGKSAPMSSKKPNSNPNPNPSVNFSKNSIFNDQDSIFRPNNKTPDADFVDLGDFSHGVPSKSTGSHPNSLNFDSIFGGVGSGSRFSSLPVFDNDNVDVGPISSSSDDVFDDLLGGLGKNETRGRADGPGFRGGDEGFSSFDDLLPGFGSGSYVNRTSSDATKKTSHVMDDPFVVLESASPPPPSSSGTFTENPLDEISNLNNFSKKPAENSTSKGVFDDLDPLNSLGKSVPAFSAEVNGKENVESPSQRYQGSNPFGPTSPLSDEIVGSTDEVWLSVTEIPLFTHPTTAPPPSRTPPTRGSYQSRVDELEDFAKGRKQSNDVVGGSDVASGDDFDANSAAMKDAMDKAEARFRHARGVRERENAKANRTRECVEVEKEEIFTQDTEERDLREYREREEEEEEERRRIEKEREEKEREKRRVERERELGRQAVERANREARERAGQAAVQKAQAEARERAERAAVQRAQAEARERAAADAKERAEKARADVREKEARERAARANQEKNENDNENDNDVESFCGMGSRASSAPRPRASSSDPFETQFQSKPNPEATRSSDNSSSSTNIVDDLSSIFGGPPLAGKYQEVKGETEERRKARLERHQRTQERTVKALAEKNARDLEAQREQVERHRIAETFDGEIKRWAAGKEGNLRALLSTLQYVLWPECGWQPVSLTDLITGVAVKKVYRKATLCIHPDKVQQKGATLYQKYVAEKVFDLLKEAWNKFNSEEPF